MEKQDPERRPCRCCFCIERRLCLPGCPPRFAFELWRPEQRVPVKLPSSPTLFAWPKQASEILQGSSGLRQGQVVQDRTYGDTEGYRLLDS